MTVLGLWVEIFECPGILPFLLLLQPKNRDRPKIVAGREQLGGLLINEPAASEYRSAPVLRNPTALWRPDTMVPTRRHLSGFRSGDASVPEIRRFSVRL
jgi:hypothetical protein